MGLALLSTLLLGSTALAAHPHLTWRNEFNIQGASNGTNGTTPASSNPNGSGRYNTTTIPAAPLGPCRFTDEDLFQNITSACGTAITAIQTCPKEGADVQDLLRAATSFSDCFEIQYRLYTRSMSPIVKAP